MSPEKDLNAQAWTYIQETGELQQDGKPVATGYSGAGSGKNNPDLQDVHNIGPIPQGDWTISGPRLALPSTGLTFYASVPLKRPRPSDATDS